VPYPAFDARHTFYGGIFQRSVGNSPAILLHFFGRILDLTKCFT
jgi:hypothetical protein